MLVEELNKKNGLVNKTKTVKQNIYRWWWSKADVIRRRKTLDFTFIFCFLSCAYQVELLVDDEKKTLTKRDWLIFFFRGFFRLNRGYWFVTHNYNLTQTHTHTMRREWQRKRVYGARTGRSTDGLATTKHPRRVDPERINWAWAVTDRRACGVKWANVGSRAIGHFR